MAWLTANGAVSSLGEEVAGGLRDDSDRTTSAPEVSPPCQTTVRE